MNKRLDNLPRIFNLEEQVELLSQKIKRMQKHNDERSPVGREGMHEQIETHIRIAINRRKAMLEELEELEKNE